MRLWSCHVCACVNVYVLTEYALTTTVCIWRFSRSILKTIQNLPLPNVAVPHQEEFEEIVVTLHRTSLGSHSPSHLSSSKWQQKWGNRNDAKDVNP